MTARVLSFILALLISVTGLSACDQGGTVDGKVAEARLRNDGPAIWVVEDVDSTLYLFGTVHLLPSDLSWQRDDMRDAFDRAGTIFFEVDTGPKAQIDASVLTTSLGQYRGGQILSDRLDSYQLKLLEAASNNAKISLPALNSMKPWLASEFLMIAAATDAGLSPELSADDALKNRARRMRKNVRYLDTIEAQIRASADQPDFVQMTVLTEALINFNALGSDASQVARAWSVGHTQFLTTALVDAVKKRSPDMYLSLFSDKNTEWANTLTRFLEGSGTGFAAVGVGHLLGEDSLQARLRAQGYTVTRYYAFQGENVIKPAFTR